MLRKVLIATWRRLTGAQLDRVPLWHVPGSLSLWMYPNGPMEKGSHHEPLVLLFHEWSAGGIWGLTFTGHYWVHGNEVKSSRAPDKLEDELLGVFEDHQAVAMLIARGKLKRLGELPSQMLAHSPQTSAQLGVWG
jgi:hypothetical protein